MIGRVCAGAVADFGSCVGDFGWNVEDWITAVWAAARGDGSFEVSYNWLKTMVELPEDPKDLAAEFIRTGTEVEAIDAVGEAFDQVVTAQVVSKEPHPDSDHMWLCKDNVGTANVDKDGNPEPLQIVCDAQNFNEGDHIVTAMIGAELPGGLKIKKSKLRGVESCGMNCSARELGFPATIPAS